MTNQAITSQPITNSAADAPLFEVTKGNPNAEELAALTAVVLALAGAEGAAAPDDDSAPVAQGRAWIRRERLRLAPTPGPGAWRRSAWR